MSSSRRAQKPSAQLRSKAKSKQAAKKSPAVPAGDWDKLSNEALQRVLGKAVRVYAARVQAGDKFRPFAPGSGITATDVMVAGTMMMKAVNVQLFEFGMWQAWSGNF
jgi:hypothetical protein